VPGVDRSKLHGTAWLLEPTDGLLESLGSFMYASVWEVGSKTKFGGQWSSCLYLCPGVAHSRFCTASFYCVLLILPFSSFCSACYAQASRLIFVHGQSSHLV